MGGGGRGTEVLEPKEGQLQVEARKVFSCLGEVQGGCIWLVVGPEGELSSSCLGKLALLGAPSLKL